MPFLLNSPSHGNLHFSKDIPDKLEDLAQPGADAYAAIGSFGDFLFQTFNVRDYAIGLHYAFPKEQVVTMHKVDGPALYIIVVLNGQVTQKIEDQEISELKEWKFHITSIPQSASITTTYNRGMDVRYITIRVGVEILTEMNKSIQLPQEVFSQLQSEIPVMLIPKPLIISNSLFLSLTNIMSNHLPPFGREYYYLLQVNYLVSILLYDAFSPQEKVPNKDLEVVMKAKNLIEEAVSSPLSGRQIAIKVEMNYYRLRRVFNEVMGTSLADYIVTAKLNHARTLLQDSNKSIKQIAASCGYKSTDSFITAFRKRFNITPNASRKRLMS